MIRTTEWCWRYFEWLCDLETRCLHPGIPEHRRRGSQGQCRGCWAELVNKIRIDAAEDDA